MAYVGHSHTVAVKTDGTLWAWGANAGLYGYGQVGDGTPTDSHAPGQLGAGFSVVAAGGSSRRP